MEIPVEWYSVRYSVKVSPSYDHLTDALLAWSEFHRSAGRKPRSWDSANLLVQGAEVLENYAREHLRKALADSEEALEPLGDPLSLNVGGHRWLSADREESYSDWLAWILQGMSSADILQLFTLADEPMGEPIAPVGRIRREVCSEDGRTDIEVPLGERDLLLIEVKVRNTSDHLTSQLRRYRQNVANLKVERPRLVLLGKEAPEPSVDLHGFTFTSWEALCQRLRQYAKRVKESDLLRAAAVLIFCGAVEQNLLGLSDRPRRFRAMATVNYLHGWRCEA